VNADNAPDTCSPNILDNIGCIEVIVLRCAGSRHCASSEQALPLAFGMDGASEVLKHGIGMYGQAREWDSGLPLDYADLYSAGRRRASRSQRSSRPASSYAKTIWSCPASAAAGDFHNQLNGRDDSPSIIERLHTNRAMSPGFPFNRSMSPAGFRYGSGPVPHAPRAESEAELFRNRTPGSIVTDAPIVDPKWLDQFVAQAVERKLREKGEKKKSSHIYKKPNTAYEPDPNVSLPPPRAWPISPFGPLEQPPNPIEETSFGNQRGSSRPKVSISIKNDDPSWDESYGQWEQKPPWVNIAHVKWANAIETDVASCITVQNGSSDSWKTSSWGTKDDNPDLQRKKSESKWSNQNTPNLPPASFASLSSHRSVEDWVHVDSLPDNSIVDKRPFRSSTAWCMHENTGWTDRKMEGIPSSSSSTWGGIQTVGPPPRGSIATRRSSRSDNEKKKNKEEKEKKPNISIPPMPTWGCGVAHRPEEFRTAPAHIPPPAYSLESWMHNVSLGSSMSTPWQDVQKDESSDSSDSWDIGDRVETGTGSKKKKGQSEWEGTIGNNVSSSSWCKNRNLKNEQSKPADWKGLPHIWNGRTWTASDHKTQVYDSWKQTDNMPGAWDKNSDTDSQSEVKSTWKDYNWEKKNESNDQCIPSPACDLPEIGFKEKSDDFVKEPWDSNGWKSTPNDKQDISLKTTTSHHSARNSTKSQDQKHQQDRTISASGPKEHWKFPPPPSKKLYPIPTDYDSVSTTGNRKIWTAPKESLYSIPASKAKQEMLEHQVRAGKGTKYHHIVGRPKYLDSLEKPYAVFRFKYRSRDVLRHMLGAGVVPEEEEESAPSPVLEEKLQGLSKEEIVQMYMELKDKLNGKEGSAVTPPTIVGNWVVDQQVRSQEVNSKGRKEEENPMGMQGWGGPLSTKTPANSRSWGISDAGLRNARKAKNGGNNGWDGNEETGWRWGGGGPAAPKNGW
jgi:hypothetical protein